MNFQASFLPAQSTATARWLGLVLCALVPAAVWAADADPKAESTTGEPDFTMMSLEDLGAIKVPTVVGASKHEQKTTEAPSSVSIVTQEDIKTYGYRTLGDVLKGVRGFYVTYDRAYQFTGLRGVNRPGDFGGRVLINIDGHRLNEPIYDSAFTHTDLLLDLDLLERVEIIRGPGSSLYGNNAFFTVINLVTRRGRDLNGLEVSGTAGSWDAYSGRLSYGRQFTNGVELLVSATHFDSDGHEALRYPEFKAVNHGIAKNLDGNTATSVFASLGWKDFTLAGGYIDRRKEVPTAQYDTVFNDPNFLNIDRRGYAELKYAHELGDDWSLRARAYYDHYRFDGTFPFNYLAPDPGPATLNKDRMRADSVGGEVLVSKTLWQRHLVTLGGEWRDDFQLAVGNFDVRPPATYVDARRDQASFAFYAQDEVAILTNLTLSAGVRYDYFSTFGDTVNPRGALIYTPWREGTFKLIYGQAFRAPNASERDYIQPTFKANPGLGPETIRSYELVYEQGLTGNLRASGSLFLNQITDLIGQSLDPDDGLNFFDNLDEVAVRGFELELEGRWKHGLRGRLSYTYAEARDTSTDRRLDNSPRHLAKAHLALPLWRENVFLGFELQGMSSRQTVQGAEIHPFVVGNVTLFSRELVKNLEASASLYNVFDKKYSDPSSSDFVQDSIPQDGRSFRVKLTYRF